MVTSGNGDSRACSRFMDLCSPGRPRHPLCLQAFWWFKLCVSFRGLLFNPWSHPPDATRYWHWQAYSKVQTRKTKVEVNCAGRRLIEILHFFVCFIKLHSLLDYIIYESRSLSSYTPHERSLCSIEMLKLISEYQTTQPSWPITGLPGAPGPMPIPRCPRARTKAGLLGPLRFVTKNVGIWIFVWIWPRSTSSNVGNYITYLNRSIPGPYIRTLRCFLMFISCWCRKQDIPTSPIQTGLLIIFFGVFL